MRVKIYATRIKKYLNNDWVVQCNARHFRAFALYELSSKSYNDLFIEYDYSIANLKKTTDKHPWSKYLDVLPNNNFKINFNEQKTPLIKIDKFAQKYGFTNLYLKDESKNPTTSFKDREP